MATTTKKTTSVFTRVTPELKDQAEKVLNKLQIPMSTALNMFLQQVVEQQGIPFEVKLHHQPANFSSLSKQQFDQEIQKGFTDFKNGDSYTTAEIQQELNNRNQ